jgi:hypothetical protein
MFLCPRILIEEKEMSINWQNLNKPDSRNGKSDDTPQTEPVLKVIRVLQKAGFCVYPSNNEGDNIAFIVPVTTDAWFPQNFYSTN